VAVWAEYGVIECSVLVQLTGNWMDCDWVVDWRVVWDGCSRKGIWGRFTLFFGNFSVGKCLSVPSICQVKIFDLPNLP